MCNAPCYINRNLFRQVSRGTRSNARESGVKGYKAYKVGGCRLHGSWIAGCRLQVAGCGLQVAEGLSYRGMLLL